jgi:hypothetical protein
VVIDSTPLLGELTVLPYNNPDKQHDQVAKGVKRSADSAPKAFSSREEAKETLAEDSRVLKRFLQVKGPALRPYESWATTKENLAFLNAFAKKHASASDTLDFSPTTVMKYFDIQRDLKIGITISRVPYTPVDSSPAEKDSEKDLEQMYGSGHTADLKRLMQIFNAPVAISLLKPEKHSLMYEQKLAHEVYDNFVTALKVGPPEEKYSVRKPSRDRAPRKARQDASSTSSRPPPEPSRPPSSRAAEPYARSAASTRQSDWQTWSSEGWDRNWSSWSNWRSWLTIVTFDCSVLGNFFSPWIFTIRSLDR